MNFHRNWIDKNADLLSNNNFYSKEEMTEEVKEHFEFRCKYSNEGESITVDSKYVEQVLIQDHSNPINENRTDRKLHLSMDTHVVSGSKILWNNDLWLIVSSIKNVGNAYKSAQIQQCNYTLPFQNGTSTIILEPCIVSDSQSTIGEDQNNVMTVPDAFRHILVQYNANTSKLVKGKRIFIDRVCDNPSVYEITKVDRIVHMDGDNGLLYLTCNEGQTIDKDRKDLLIADYISSSTPTPSPTPTSSGSCAITMNNGTAYTTVQNIRIGGTGNYFNALFKDANGNVLTGLTPTWTLTDLNGITNSDITVSDVSGYPLRIKVKVTYKTALIGSSFKIHLIDSGNTLSSYDVSCKVVSLT